jgi:hypothetical protein
LIPERVLAPFEEPSFQSGIRFGLVALAVGVLCGLVWRRRWSSPSPVAGLLLAAAAVVTLDEVGRLDEGLIMALAALGVAGLITDAYPPARPALVLLALPGAGILASSVVARQSWAPVAVGLVAALGGALVATFDLEWRAQPLGPALMAVSVAGVFVTVPETAEALPVFGVAIPLALLGWPLSLARLGAGGSLAATGLLAWTVAQGGTFRDSALVGGLACLGLLVALPVGTALVRRTLRQARSDPWPPVLIALAVVGVHLVVVALVARVAGLRDDLGSAVIIAGVVLTLAVVAGAALARATVRPLADRS